MRLSLRSLFTASLLILMMSVQAFAQLPLGELLGSKMGQYVMRETYYGKQLAEQILGREVQTAADWAALQSRLGQPGMRRVSRDLETRLNFVEERFRINRARQVTSGTRVSRLSQGDKSILDTLASEELEVITGSGRSIQFAPRPTSSSLAMRRMEFMDGPDATAFSEAFPSTVATGALETRLNAFVRANSRVAKKVSGVKFEMQANGRTYSGERDVLVISLKGLNETQKARLMKAYLNAISKGTVSFPLNEGAGHLHTRLGVKDLDFMNPLDINDYRLPGSKRLEPVLSLNPSEEARLRTFIANARDQSGRVLGDFGYEGVASGRTRGRLTDNRPMPGCGEHNCTSWITTAPVGAEGEALLEIAGASASWNVHTNPGWWSNFLMVSAPAERVPVAIYWTTEESMTQALRTIRSGEVLPWNFSAH